MLLILLLFIILKTLNLINQLAHLNNHLFKFSYISKLLSYLLQKDIDVSINIKFLWLHQISLPPILKLLAKTKKYKSLLPCEQEV